MNDKTSQTLPLLDGRQLGFAEYGDRMGTPLFYFHGIPGSRRECPMDESLLHELNIRLIIPERPGYGLSDFQDNRAILNWPDDVTQLADALILDRFAVLGFSGGGTYALACAHELKGRLTAVGLVSCLAPLDAPSMWDCVSPVFRSTHELAASDPVTLEQQLVPAAASPETILAVLEEPSPPADQATLADPAFRAMYLSNFTESLLQGAKATAWDLHLVDRPWGFDLTRIQQPVQLWHGMDDRNAPIAMGHYLADTLPQCTAHFMENEGHCSLFNHMEVILQQLKAP